MAAPFLAAFHVGDWEKSMRYQALRTLDEKSFAWDALIRIQK